MKPHPLILILAWLPAALHAQTAQPAFRDAATHEQLSQKFRVVSQNNPMKHLPVATGEDPTVVNRVGNLLENSDVLTFKGLTTLVPKNALVLIPEKFKGVVNSSTNDTRIVSWLDFYAQNRGWISTVEITFAQARGDEPVNPETLAALGKSGNLVVAVLKGGPISLMPPKPATPTETASKDN
jgi:hypothetical protein